MRLLARDRIGLLQRFDEALEWDDDLEVDTEATPACALDPLGSGELPASASC